MGRATIVLAAIRNVSYYAVFISFTWFALSSSNGPISALVLIVATLGFVLLHEAMHFALLRAYGRAVRFVVVGDLFLTVMGEDFGVGFQTPSEMVLRERRLHAVCPLLAVVAASLALLLFFPLLILASAFLLALALSSADLAFVFEAHKGTPKGD